MCMISVVMMDGLASPQEWLVPDKLPEFELRLTEAKKIDEENGEPDCELDSKRLALKVLAEKLGVEITFP